MLLLLYKAIVRSKLDYECSITYFNTKNNVSKLNKKHYVILRCVLGYMKSTPITTLLGKLEKCPLNIEIPSKIVFYQKCHWRELILIVESLCLLMEKILYITSSNNENQTKTLYILLKYHHNFE